MCVKLCPPQNTDALSLEEPKPWKEQISGQNSLGLSPGLHPFV